MLVYKKVIQNNGYMKGYYLYNHVSTVLLFVDGYSFFRQCRLSFLKGYHSGENDRLNESVKG